MINEVLKKVVRDWERWELMTIKGDNREGDHEPELKRKMQVNVVGLTAK